ncbi:myosin regulatory light chain 12B-like [Dendronephthya gigantea]|uniref:myosin regulatory light chain 12B-like n=1 Tax=Dendronephthya gigantea TaxID=151771 RepID=UPI00106CF349|nr:myosin regulatory light chain 12B-like [Dendronephthya gigantea]
MSKKAKGKTKKKAQRAASNVFAMFDQQTIQEFKEAFNMIDVGRDGFIDKSDLNETYINLGRMTSDEELESMVSEAPGPMNFTVFLTLFGDRLNGTDPEDVIRNAFGCFDEAGTGKIPEEKLKRMLMQTGDRFTEEEVEEMFNSAPMDRSGNLLYADFCKTIKGSAKEED